MKIAIFGSYNGTSIGDTAILLGLLHGIAEVTPEAEVTVLTMGPLDLSRDLALTGLTQPPRLLRANVRAPAQWPVLRSLWWRLQYLGLPLDVQLNRTRCRKLLAGQDLLIIGGGNLLMDLFESGVDLIENIVAAAQEVGTPYAFAGVGAGPVTKAATAKRLAACLAPARRVVVRDEPSRSLCVQHLKRADTECAPDLAFALPPHFGTDTRDTLTVNVAAIGAVTWPVQDAHGYHCYLDGVSRLVLAAAAQIQPRRIEIVTTNPAVDLCAAQDLATRLQGKTTMPVLLPVLKDVTDILDAFGRSRLAIVTRLHAGITAALAGCPVLPIAYQSKVAAVLSEQSIAPNAVALDTLRHPNFDAGTALAQAVQHGVGLRPGTRVQALSAIRDLLQGTNNGKGER